jgi:hypothetical protein
MLRADELAGDCVQGQIGLLDDHHFLGAQYVPRL